MDIHDQEILADVEYFNDYLWEELRYQVIKRNLSSFDLDLDTVQLVLELRAHNDDVLCCYYFVNPASRSLFWLGKWDAPDVFDACRGVDAIPHKGEPRAQWLTVIDLRCELNDFCRCKDWQFKLCTGTTQW